MMNNIQHNSTTEKFLEGDVEMTSSEIGTEDLEFSDILEREGMEFNTMVEKWKKKGMEHIPEEEVDRVNFLFLTRQDAEIKGQKRGFGQRSDLESKSKVYIKQTIMPNIE